MNYSADKQPRLNHWLPMPPITLTQLLQGSCRLCLCKLVPTCRINLSSKDQNGVSFHQMASELSGIQLSDQNDSGHTMDVCLSCAGNLVNFYQFRLTCQKNLLTSIQMKLVGNNQSNCCNASKNLNGDAQEQSNEELNGPPIQNEPTDEENPSTSSFKCHECPIEFVFESIQHETNLDVLQANGNEIESEKIDVVLHTAQRELQNNLTTVSQNGQASAPDLNKNPDNSKITCSCCNKVFHTSYARTIHEQKVHFLDSRECRICHKMLNTYKYRYIHEGRCRSKAKKSSR